MKADLTSSVDGYYITFIAFHIRSEGGEATSNVKGFWATCFQGVDCAHWIRGETHGPYSYNPDDQYGHVINAVFALDYLYCDSRSLKWKQVRKEEMGGMRGCKWITELDIIGNNHPGHWDCWK